MVAFPREQRRVFELLQGFHGAQSASRERFNASNQEPSSGWEQYGLTSEIRRSLFIRWLFEAIGGLSLFWGYPSPFVFGLVCGVAALEYLLFKRRAFLRVEAFEKDYPALLLSLASGVRTGLDPLSALLRVQETLPNDSLVREELRRVKVHLDAGMPERQAIGTFAQSVSHPDVPLFRTAFILAREQGSSLAQCLQRLTKVTRARQSFRRKMRAAVAMQRMSSLGILFCAVLICGFQVVANVKAFREAWNHSLGFTLMVAGGSLLVLGISWMMFLCRRRV